jgi:hypothetical protein
MDANHIVISLSVKSHDRTATVAGLCGKIVVDNVVLYTD